MRLALCSAAWVYKSVVHSQVVRLIANDTRRDTPWSAFAGQRDHPLVSALCLKLSLAVSGPNWEVPHVGLSPLNTRAKGRRGLQRNAMHLLVVIGVCELVDDVESREVSIAPPSEEK